MGTDWTTLWETESTCFKDCDSTIGIWNDPPLRLPISNPISPIAVGKGYVHLLDDCSIAALLPRFASFKGRKIGCLYDSHRDDQALFHFESLLPRYLFNHGVLSQRIYPSDQYGYVDENNLFCWPVALSQFDALFWIKSEGELAVAMRTQCKLAPLLQFLKGGGELYLGGVARRYLPYLLDGSTIAAAFQGVRHLGFFGDPAAKARISDRCCELSRVDAEGRSVIAQHYAVEHAPHGFQTHAEYDDGIALTISVCFESHDLFVLEWAVENRLSVEREVHLVLSGDMHLAEMPPVGSIAGGKMLRLDLSQRLGAPGTLGIANASGASVPWECEGEAYTLRFKVDLAGAEKADGSFLLAVAFSTDAEESIEEKIAPFIERVSPWGRARDRWGDRFRAIEPLSNGNEHERQLLERAAATIVGNTWQPPLQWADGNYGRRRVLEVQRSYYPGWYPYEAGFYASGVRNFDAALARDMMELFPPVQKTNGRIPLGIFHRDVQEFNGLSQVSSLAYGTWQTYLAEPRQDFLENVYEGLRGNIDWWSAHRLSRERGVFGFAHGQEGGGDDHPRSDEPGGGLRGGMGRFLSPDASGFILMEMHCMANIAAALGRHDEVAEWRERIRALDGAMLEVCYDRAANFFADVDIAGGAFHHCVNPWHFVPLWAGVSLDPQAARQMVRDYLVETLMGSVPFPIVERDDPAYLSDVYWRGPSWPQLWLICLQVLWWYGFHREADGAANALIDMCGKSPYLMEIYDGESGEALSLPEYSFVAAILFEIVPRRYRDEPPWRNATIAA